jgi:Na+/H+ antiporter NhaD/arsenite permease-like protein
LGNAPLLFGFLLGVPFWWTLKLFSIWFFVVTSLLGIFAALDSYFFLRDPDFRGPMKQELKANFKIIGRWNLALIPLVIAGLILPKLIPLEYTLWRTAARVAVMLIVIALSRRLTPKQVDTLNNFSWEPLIEVATIFAAIFATMIPAINYLELHAHEMGLNSTWSFFWLSGIVSSIFNNAPTFAAFFATAQGLGRDYAMITLENGTAISSPLLMAISCGSVLFGALTYLGNGPNLLVKGVAEEESVKMPSFFSYILWSIAFLVPVLLLTAILFFEY